ncbi:MAG: zinc ribbon domain-containing protein [Deltaproteobacteria bacterium]|nr:zinc ribbon domain-containing protein [Deltaproteobacteria bacterium]
MSVLETTTDLTSCPACDVSNRRGARFCKSCGASIRAPAQCPSCRAALPPEARFCSGCGSRVIGARPRDAAAPPLQVNLPVAPPAGAQSAVTNRESAQRLVEQLREHKKAKSNIGINLLAFVAVLLLFLVFMREWNQGRPKEGTMFGGGGPAPAPATGGAEVATGPALHATVTLSDAVKEGAQGTLFVIVRPAGGPDRGPPLAVKRLDAPSFPLQVEIGPQDVMLKGMPFTGPFDLQARLDRDANAMTKDPEDRVASAPPKGVKPGDTLEIVLDRRVGELADEPTPGAAAASAAADQAPRAPAPTAAAGASPAAPPAAAAPATGGEIRGTIDVAPTLKAGLPDGAIFIVLRAPGSPDRGPPVAVKRYEHGAFPMRFEVGPQDVMLPGATFGGPFDVYVRFDADGNAMTRLPGDLELSAPKTGVKPGESSLSLVLDRRR